jgi:hypothetical protein
MAGFVDTFGINDERADQPECRRRVLWLAAGKHHQKGEKKDAGPHVSDSKLKVDVANFSSRRSWRCLHFCGDGWYAKVDIANFEG